MSRPKGFKHSEETKLKQKLSGLGRQASEETRKKMSEAKKGKEPWNRGVPHTEIAKQKMGNSHKGLLVGELNPMFGRNMSRENNPAWKGGRIGSGAGYMWVLKPEHPFANKSGYIFEHRLIMEKELGRYLTLEEVVHHENEIKDDNRIENLKLFSSKSEHVKYHYKKTRSKK